MSKESNPPKTIPARIELIDNWHKNWDAALLMITNLGALDCLMIDEDGWLSARQNLFVAYVGQKPIGFLCFRVQPQQRTAATAQEESKPLLEASVDGSAIDPAYDTKKISRQLLEAAMNRALELRCQRFVGKSRVDV
jgi:hypothetical protein